MISPEQFHTCHDCQKFTIDIEKKPPSLHPSHDKNNRSDIFLFNATLEDVLTGLINGCELCLWLDSLWGGEPSSDQERYGILKASENTARIVVCAETYSMSLVDRYPVDEIMFFGLWEENAPSRPHWGKCLVFGKCSIDIFTTQDEDASHFIRNRPINCSPGSTKSLGLVRQWLQQCQTSHVRCREFSQDYMPLRVLRISSGCSSCDFHVALDTTTKAEPFAALSYCWGGDQVYKTTKARIQSTDASLQWCKISKSLQDAIKVTAALGLQCLWVDSMCIIQDDEDDKAVQIADMARIYSQATVTIIASRASRAVDGFLGEINLRSQTSLAVRLPFRCPGKDRTVGSAYLTHIEGSKNSSEPIDARAWTLQERYLSNRVIEFGSLQTGWTCASSSASTITSNNTYVDGWKWDKSHEGYNSQMLYLHADLLADLAEFAIQHSSAAWICDWLNSRWETVLSEYTPRLLSVPTDRILGISGVADMFLSHRRNEGRNESEEYLAGMWKSSLPSMLCWHAVSGAKDRGRLPPPPEIYQGPSWSWAGVNCHVSFIFGRACNSDCRTVLLDADIKLANNSAKCGSVTRAVLTLKGRMRPALWNLVDGTLEVDADREVAMRGEVRDAMGINTRKARLATIYPDTSSSRGESSKEHWPRVPIQLLEIGNCVSLKRRGPVGLVLEPMQVSSDTDIPRFRRLGLFHIDTKQTSATAQLGHPPTQQRELEGLRDFFEGKLAHVIQLE
ncbi:heterokaryon incompatibility protein-domain-containing protein [Nemania sp. FL0031]|nr:heterokaryon incompatibility protein-domain-containing protein [Nemania sp. FL0031]